MVAVIAVLLVGVFSEDRPKFTWQQCTKSGCTAIQGSVVTDVEARGDDPTADIDYESCIGVTSTGTSLSQRLVSTCRGEKVVGSRLYLLDSSGTKYEQFTFVGKEISYTVDMSQVECGVNAAFYTGEMSPTGKSNDASLGTGYCDANYVGGTGCAEFDIQEANAHAMVYTTHTCSQSGRQTGSGQCDTGGCGFNAYKYGNHTLWGGLIDVSKPVTVVTQFLASGSTLTEIRRKYVQAGRVFENPTIPVQSGRFDSITDGFCKAAGWTTDGTHSLANFGASLARGHTLVFSLWDSDNMGWLDGGDAGTCTSHNVAQVEQTKPNLKVTWSDLKYGDIDTTY